MSTSVRGPAQAPGAKLPRARDVATHDSKFNVVDYRDRNFTKAKSRPPPEILITPTSPQGFNRRFDLAKNVERLARAGARARPRPYREMAAVRTPAEMSGNQARR